MWARIGPPHKLLEDLHLQRKFRNADRNYGIKVNEGPNMSARARVTLHHMRTIMRSTGETKRPEGEK